MKPPRGPLVLVHVSMYQGNPFWGYHFFFDRSHLGTAGATGLRMMMGPYYELAKVLGVEAGAGVRAGRTRCQEGAPDRRWGARRFFFCSSSFFSLFFWGGSGWCQRKTKRRPPKNNGFFSLLFFFFFFFFGWCQRKGQRRPTEFGVGGGVPGKHQRQIPVALQRARGNRSACPAPRGH